MNYILQIANPNAAGHRNRVLPQKVLAQVEVAAAEVKAVGAVAAEEEVVPMAEVAVVEEVAAAVI